MKTTPYFIDILTERFQSRISTNPRYSLRAYARDLGVSVALLSGLLNGKKGLSEKTAIIMCKTLNLSRQQSKDFMLSVSIEHSRSPKKREESQKILDLELSRKKSKTVMKDEALKSSANWIHLAILELCDLPSCEHNIKWFANMLKINEIATDRAVRTLLNSGQLAYKNGRYSQTLGETTTAMDVPSPLIKKFHSEVMDRAKQSLFADSTDHREFQGVTLAFSISDIKEAKEMIRAFQEEFIERFYRTSTKKRNSVYQFSTQLFPLTQIK